MKRLCSFICAVCLIGVCLLNGITVTASQEIMTEGCFEYTVQNSEATILKMFLVDGPVDYSIPETLGGYPLTRIGDKAYAFFSASSVEIPANIKSIDEHAFDYVYRLGTITVDEENQQYSSVDGILYDKEIKTLIRCPEGYLGNIVIPDGVEKICDSAFFACRHYSYNLEVNRQYTVIPKSVKEMKFEASAYYGHIYFGGSKEEWEELEISEKIPASEVCLNYVSGNDTIITEQIAADYCDENGVIRTKCAHCDYVVSEKVIESLGHRFNSGAISQCRLCNTVRKEIIQDDFTYEIINDKATVIKWTGDGTTVKIPNTVNKYPVVAIDNAVFENKTLLESVYISANIEELPNFVNCEALKKITVDNRNLRYFSVDGILYDRQQKRMVHCPKMYMGKIVVPDGIEKLSSMDSRSYVTEIVLPEGFNQMFNETSFYGCHKLKKLYIPSTQVMGLEDAIRHISNVEEINVSPENPVYTSVDGIVYDKAMKEVVQIPGGKDIVKITDGVLGIRNTALFNHHVTIGFIFIPESVRCFDVEIPTFKHIYFAGTQEEWDKLKVSFSQIESYTIHFDVKYDDTLLTSVITEADCENAGYNDVECTICNSSYRITIPALGHTHGKLVFDNGTYSYACLVCEDTVYAEPQYEKGDANGDGKINSTDFMLARRHFLELITLDNEGYMGADINRDGIVNSTDFMQIRRKYLGI